MKILAFVPARGGSKSIYKKNIFPLCGKPLLAYTAEAIKESKLFYRAIVSTDSQEIADVAIDNGLEVPYLRSKILSRDNSTTLSVLTDFFYDYQRTYKELPDYVMVLQPTSPLRTYKNIVEAFTCFEPSKYNSLVSVCEVPHNMNPDCLMKKDNNTSELFALGNPPTLRQYKESYYARNGASIYLLKPQLLLDNNLLLSPPIQSYVMNKIESIDIDTYQDMFIAESILLNKSHTIKGTFI